jgi:hypothetical protein
VKIIAAPVQVNEDNAHVEEQHRLPRVWARYGIGGEVVSAGCVKQAAGGLSVAERIACDVVLLQKAGASDRRCGRSRCTSYATLRRRRKDRRAPRKDAHAQEGWGRRQYIHKQETGEYKVRGEGKREGKIVEEKRTEDPLASVEFAGITM